MTHVVTSVGGSVGLSESQTVTSALTNAVSGQNNSRARQVVMHLPMKFACHIYAIAVSHKAAQTDDLAARLKRLHSATY